MAHNINVTNGKASIAYANGVSPWHGLGHVVDSDRQTVPAMQAESGQDFVVSTRPIATQSAPESAYDLIVPGARAIVRDDTNVPLSTVSDRYTPFQNKAAGELVEALVTTGAKVEVAGVLGKGERCWMLTHVPGDFHVPGTHDDVNTYFLLTWGHDGKHGIQGKLTPVCVVCENTLNAAASGGFNINLKHSRNLAVNIDEARTALGLVSKHVAETAELYTALGNREMTGDEVRDYFAQVFPYSRAVQAELGESDTDTVARLMGSTSTARKLSDMAREAMARTDEVRETLAQLLQVGKGAADRGRTAWAVYNAVTEYVDHVYPVLQNGATSTTRQQSALFGAYADTKATALEFATLLAK